VFNCRRFIQQNDVLFRLMQPTAMQWSFFFKFNVVKLNV